jgi:hypothetical protein
MAAQLRAVDPDEVQRLQREAASTREQLKEMTAVKVVARPREAPALHCVALHCSLWQRWSRCWGVLRAAWCKDSELSLQACLFWPRWHVAIGAGGAGGRAEATCGAEAGRGPGTTPSENRCAPLTPIAIESRVEGGSTCPLNCSTFSQRPMRCSASSPEVLGLPYMGAMVRRRWQRLPSALRVLRRPRSGRPMRRPRPRPHAPPSAPAPRGRSRAPRPQRRRLRTSGRL